jgi:hypothetical protein
METERQAMTVFEYRNPPNLLHPDHVRLLNATAFHIPRGGPEGGRSGSEVVRLRVKGFLVEAPSPLEKLELCVYHSLASLRMEQGPVDAKETLALSTEWALHEQSCNNLSWSSGLPVSLLPGK